MFDNYSNFSVAVDGATISGKVTKPSATPRPALLLLHGHPQTHLMWHEIADPLAEEFTVVAADLPGYGSSTICSTVPTHDQSSKKTMASLLIALMVNLGRERGFQQFSVVAHDRGARVAQRMCIDHSDVINRAMLLDIAPTADMYGQTSFAFARAYWHWFFLIQPYPLPEQLISSNPEAYLKGVMGNRHAGLAPFPPEVLHAYTEALRRPDVAHGICEDYRASATIDLEHDKADRLSGVRVDTPLRVLWAKHGVIEQLFEPMRLWRAVASDVSGRAIDCGHYLAEEQPQQVLDEIREFLRPPL